MWSKASNGDEKRANIQNAADGGNTMHFFACICIIITTGPTMTH